MALNTPGEREKSAVTKLVHKAINALENAGQGRKREGAGQDLPLGQVGRKPPCRSDIGGRPAGGKG